MSCDYFLVKANTYVKTGHISGDAWLLCSDVSFRAQGEWGGGGWRRVCVSATPESGAGTQWCSIHVCGLAPGLSALQCTP